MGGDVQHVGIVLGQGVANRLRLVANGTIWTWAAPARAPATAARMAAKFPPRSRAAPPPAALLGRADGHDDLQRTIHGPGCCRTGSPVHRDQAMECDGLARARRRHRLPRQLPECGRGCRTGHCLGNFNADREGHRAAFGCLDDPPQGQLRPGPAETTGRTQPGSPTSRRDAVGSGVRSVGSWSSRTTPARARARRRSPSALRSAWLTPSCRALRSTLSCGQVSRTTWASTVNRRSAGSVSATWPAATGGVTAGICSSRARTSSVRPPRSNHASSRRRSCTAARLSRSSPHPRRAPPVPPHMPRSTSVEANRPKKPSGPSHIVVSRHPPAAV